MSEQEVLVPDIGDFDSVEVIDVLVSKGDTVEQEDALITLESDKASMDVPAPFSGKVTHVVIKSGDKVSEGSKILTMDVADSHSKGADQATTVKDAESSPSPTPLKAPPEQEKPQGGKSEAPQTLQATTSGEEKPADEKHDHEYRPPPVKAVDERSFSKAHASPSVRRFARELGADLGQIHGSGPKGRILKDDVQAYVKSRLQAPGTGIGLPAIPEVDFSKFGDIETKPLTRIQKISSTNLHRNWITIPHVTQFDQADITDLETFRKQQKEKAEKQDIKLTMLPFLMKACAAALQAFPDFNASLHPNGEQLIIKKYIHIGVAVDTPDGLLVPVVRDVDKKGVFTLAKELMEISQKARDKKLSPNEMQGACFSISNLGGLGGTAFTPIINAPEVAILGVSRSEMKPVYQDGEFKPRLMLPLSLSYDHRVIDGAKAARFTSHLCEVISDMRQALL